MLRAPSRRLASYSRVRSAHREIQVRCEPYRSLVQEIGGTMLGYRERSCSLQPTELTCVLARRMLVGMVWLCWLLVLVIFWALHRSLQNSIQRVKTQEEMNKKLGEVCVDRCCAIGCRPRPR